MPPGISRISHGKCDLRVTLSRWQRSEIHPKGFGMFLLDMAGGDIGTARCDDISGDLAQVLSHVGIAPSSPATHLRGWRLWVPWR